MKETKKKVDPDRRSFLKLAGVGTVVGGAALAASSTTGEAREEASKDSLYSETDHIRTYYRLARFRGE